MQGISEEKRREEQNKSEKKGINGKGEHSGGMRKMKETRDKK